jgi:hypothetical protein
MIKRFVTLTTPVSPSTRTWHRRLPEKSETDVMSQDILDVILTLIHSETKGFGA